MSKRKTFAEIRAEAKAAARDDMLAETCRVLRHHLGMEQAATALWEVYKSGDKLRQREGLQMRYEGYAPFDLIGAFYGE